MMVDSLSCLVPVLLGQSRISDDRVKWIRTPRAFFGTDSMNGTGGDYAQRYRPAARRFSISRRGCSTLKEAIMTREMLHELIERIPENEIVAAQRVLERLASDAAFRAAMSASPDDEPVTAGDADAIARARADVQAGRVVSHDEILSEFGIR
jgi:hypothetical protein